MTSSQTDRNSHQKLQKQNKSAHSDSLEAQDLESTNPHYTGISRLQRTIGNQAVQRLLERNSPMHPNKKTLHLPLVRGVMPSNTNESDEEEYAEIESEKNQHIPLVGVPPPADSDPAQERPLTNAVQTMAIYHNAPSSTIMRGKGKVAKGVIGWVVKVGERNLIKRAAIYTEKEMVSLLGKGYNILVKDGSRIARRVAEKTWGKENIIRHSGHLLKNAGKYGKPHYQPLRNVLGRTGEKGWHIFYSAAPIVFFADDVEAMAIYEDKYPGKSVANYLTISHYAGEDSWLAKLDWINPLELIAIGGDIGRSLDRERTKELQALVFNRESSDGSKQTYEMTPDGELVRVIVVSKDGAQKELSAEEYFELLGNQADGTQDVALEDGTSHENYLSTFDSEYRIYNSKQGWNWDSKTQSMFMPDTHTTQLKKLDSAYVLESPGINYIYVYVHPKHRQALRQPGFEIEGIFATAFMATSDNATKQKFVDKLLEDKLTGAKVEHLDLSK